MDGSLLSESEMFMEGDKGKIEDWLGEH